MSTNCVGQPCGKTAREILDMHHHVVIVFDIETA